MLFPYFNSINSSSSSTECVVLQKYIDQLSQSLLNHNPAYVKANQNLKTTTGITTKLWEKQFQEDKYPQQVLFISNKK